MPNGQFHKKSKGPAIRIKNPLSLVVEVRIKDGHGFDTSRTLRPGGELYVKVPHQGDYDIDAKILRYDQTGQPVGLGDGSWQKAAPVATPSYIPNQPGPVFFPGQLEVKDRRWRNVVTWQVLPGFSGFLNSVSIEIEGDAEAQLYVNGTSQVFTKSATVTYKSPTFCGPTVTVKGRSRRGTRGNIHAIIQGALIGVSVEKKAPERVTEHKPPKKTEEKVPIRSLGEIFEEFDREEVTA